MPFSLVTGSDCGLGPSRWAQIRSPESVSLCCLQATLQPRLPHLVLSGKRPTSTLSAEQCQSQPFINDLGQQTLEGILKFVSRDHGQLGRGSAHSPAAQ